MRKVLYLLFAVLSISTQTYASGYDIFVGAEGGFSWADFKGPIEKYQNHEITTYGAKVGVVNDETRIFIAYDYMDAFEDSTTREGEYQTLTLNTEAFSEPQSLFGLFDVAMFVGGHLGAIAISVDAAFGNSDANGLLYGIQTGLIANLGSTVSIETGYRISYSNFSDQKTDLDKFQVAYAGINFRF